MFVLYNWYYLPTNINLPSKEMKKWRFDLRDCKNEVIMWVGQFSIHFGSDWYSIKQYFGYTLGLSILGFNNHTKIVFFVSVYLVRLSKRRQSSKLMMFWSVRCQEQSYFVGGLIWIDFWCKAKFEWQYTKICRLLTFKMW